MKNFKSFKCWIGACLLALPLLGYAQAPLQAGPVDVVASFSILADMASQIGGERVRVHSLVPVEGHIHGYSPKPSDAKRLKEARVLVVNGFGLDDWALNMAKSAQFKGVMVRATQEVSALSRQSGMGQDPHAWQDVKNARIYAKNIAAGLMKADPQGQAFYQSRLEAFDRDLVALDEQIHAAFSSIAPDQRRFVSSHDAFFYFGAAYGVTFIPITGISEHAEPSAGQIGALIKQVRDEGARAIFLEYQALAALSKRLQQETGVRIGGTLYADSLSPAQGSAPTYIKMMQTNMQVILDALKP